MKQDFIRYYSHNLKKEAILRKGVSLVPYDRCVDVKHCGPTVEGLLY